MSRHLLPVAVLVCGLPGLASAQSQQTSWSQRSGWYGHIGVGGTTAEAGAGMAFNGGLTVWARRLFVEVNAFDATIVEGGTGRTFEYEPGDDDHDSTCTDPSTGSDAGISSCVGVLDGSYAFSLGAGIQIPHTIVQVGAGERFTRGTRQWYGMANVIIPTGSLEEVHGRTRMYMKTYFGESYFAVFWSVVFPIAR
jgi:hypothetical protein